MDVLRRITIKHWGRLGLFNLLLVAAIGMLMRLKFLLPIPVINLKYLQHAHSHFAFVGWVSHMLMLFMVAAVFGLHRKQGVSRRYSVVLMANQLCSFGMLFSFIYQGYGVISIVCATGAILVSYVFAVLLWKDMRRQRFDPKVGRWFTMALLFMILSSVGTFYLAYMMALHDVDIKRQLAAIYFYLHFQYNGWFFFAIMGLTCYILKKYAVGPSDRQSDVLFVVLRIITAPLYLLSVLWWDMVGWIYGCLVFMAVAQCIVWAKWMLYLFKSRGDSASLPAMLKSALWLVCWAVLLKFCLQALSVLPALSEYVYGFRSVIIGYLHLVLLLIVSVFLLSYLYQSAYLSWDRNVSLFFALFLIGVVLNEIFLALQAVMALWGKGLPLAHLYLLFASLVIVVGLLGLFRCASRSYFST